MALMFEIIKLSFIFIIAYAIICSLIRICCRCTWDEAREKIKIFLQQSNRDYCYHLADDPAFVNRMEDTIKIIMGDKRFNDLCQMAQVDATMKKKNLYGLPSVAITLVCENDNERLRCENVLSGIVSEFLEMHNYPESTKTEWQINKTFSLPELVIIYSETREQILLLEKLKEMDAKKTAEKYREPKDDDI